MDKTPFIAVEGPIGAGKTSLAKAISQHFHFFVLNEIVEENPFLGKFYEDISEWSFQTEMFFLCNRFKQLEDTKRNFLDLGKPIVSDYHIFKNQIFAYQTLKVDHFEKYMQVYDILTNDLPTPNMVIYINASIDTLMRHIKMRGRKIEEKMNPDYLLQLAGDYEMYMTQFEKCYPDIPLLKIDGDKVDFVKHPEELFPIYQQIHQIFQQGR